MVDTDILKYLETFLTEERINRFEQVLKSRTRYLTIAVEDIFQMHNASAIVRTCDAFGIQDVHLIEERYAERLDKNIALGAQQWVDVHSYHSTADCVKLLRSKGYDIVATTPFAGSKRLEEVEVKDKVALFFGTEKEGLSTELLDQADASIHIPMVGFSESLNVSVSAAIILHELTSALRQSQIPWQLSKEEKLIMRMDWAKKTIKNVDQIIARYRSQETRPSR